MTFQSLSLQCLFTWLIIISIQLVIIMTPVSSTSASSSSASTSSSSSSPKFSVRLPGIPYLTDWEEDDIDEESLKRRLGRWVSTGREYDIFDTRGGDGGGTSSNSIADDDNDRQEFSERYMQSRERYLQSRYASDSRRFLFSQRGGRPIPPGGLRSKKKKSWAPEIFQSVHDFWTKSITPKIDNLPKIVCRVEPTTTLKLRKTFRPLKTIVRMGADFNTQLQVWQFKSSWEEPIIGGKLTLIGNELHLTKSWQLSVGKITKTMKKKIIAFICGV